jgi:hypothetical protein
LAPRNGSAFAKTKIFAKIFAKTKIFVSTQRILQLQIFRGISGI